MERPLERPEVYSKEIDALMAAGKSQKANNNDHQTNELPSGTPDENQIEILKLAFMITDEKLYVEQVVRKLSISKQLAQYHLDELCNTHEYLSWVGNMYHDIPTYYHLTHEGRRFLVQQGYL